ncbi:MAG: MFS transporter [Candidatus Thorarchaeota archaeon]|nr:MFS transporter [Candidatus Thorarchaeota archaeon]
MVLIRPMEAVQLPEARLHTGSSAQRTFLSLNSSLWRLAVVAGIAQFSVSVWVWTFAVFLEPILDPLQIGLTFSIGSLAALAGYPISGVTADFIGRKKALIFSFIPQIAGLYLLWTHPIWPVIPIAYGLHSFGWSFVLVVSRAMPADQITSDDGPNASRKMTMVLLPTFLMDGLSPLIAVLLLNAGFAQSSLLGLGTILALVSMIASVVLVKETMPRHLMKNAKNGGHVPLHSLGGPFWKFTLAMVGYYAAWGMMIPYFGILSVVDWGLSLEFYGLAWSAFSLATATLMYNLSGIAGRRVRKALVFSLLANGGIMIVLGIGTGPVLFFILNVAWSVPIVIWISTERLLSINGIPEEMKGRALGVFQTVISSTGLFAAPLGALLWVYLDSLRMLFLVSGVLALILSLVVWRSMLSVDVTTFRPKQRTKAHTSPPHARTTDRME